MLDSATLKIHMILKRCVNGIRKSGEIIRSLATQGIMFREWFVSHRFRLVRVPLPVDQSNVLYALIHYGRLVILKTIFHKNRIAGTWGRC